MYLYYFKENQLKMKTKEKKFDSVKMMRDIRTKLHAEYTKKPGKRKEDLDRVREKYMNKTTNI